jgi:anti-sigma regulatory factor (Ser/Thr protein kinase)
MDSAPGPQGPPADVDVDVELRDPGDLERFRSVILQWCLGHGFSARTGGEVVVAVSEVATNGLVHGKPPVRVRGWRHGDSLVAQVDDRGGRTIPPTAGHHRPADASHGGLGLWLARRLAELVTIHTTGGRTTVRMQFPNSDADHTDNG